MRPLVALVGFGVAFASATLGSTMLGFDDHPGQLYRLWHVLTYGPAPWAWDRGWWAGYPELQFYPPGFAYVGALLAWATTGVFEVRTIYHALLWLAYLLPGVTAYLALARLTGRRWMALPAAFVALTLSAGLASGVNGGVRIGMVGARLAWALLPLLLVLLARWLDERRPLSPMVPPLLAAITLLHPAQLPAAVALVALAVWRAHSWRAAATEAGRALLLAAALTAFWTLPLLFRLAETRALAWGALALGDVARPLPLVLVGLAVGGLLDRAPAAPGVRLALWWLPAAAAVTALDRLAAEPLGVRWLPSDRVVDGAWMALVVAAGVAAARFAPRLEASPPAKRVPLALRAPALGLGAAALFALLSVRSETLMLRPDAVVWPALSSIERGLRLPDFWSLVSRLPDGRLLFVRSGVPLVYGVDWWRPHTHVTALTARGRRPRDRPRHVHPPRRRSPRSSTAATPAAAPSPCSPNTSTAARCSGSRSTPSMPTSSPRTPIGSAWWPSSRWRTTSRAWGGSRRARASAVGWRWRRSSSSRARTPSRCRLRETEPGVCRSPPRQAAGRPRASPTIRSGARRRTARRCRRAAARTDSWRCASRARRRR